MSAPVPSKPMREHETDKHVTQWERGYACGCAEDVSAKYTERVYFCDAHRAEIQELLELW